jgi:hypothetical protein
VNLFTMTWYAPAQGDGFYWAQRRLRVPGVGATLVLVRNPNVAWRAYDPLAAEPGLFLNFAGLDLTPESFLAFANRYGSLGGYSCLFRPEGEEEASLPGAEPLFVGRDEGVWVPGAELFSYWRDEVVWVRFLVDLWRMIEDHDRRGLARHVTWDAAGRLIYHIPAADKSHPAADWRGSGKRPSPDNYTEAMGLFPVGDLEGPALRLLQIALNTELDRSIKPTLSWQAASRTLVLANTATSLLGALYLQLAEMIDGGKKYQRCPICHRFFPLARGVNRADRVTCSPTCRTYQYRHRQERARQMKAEGKTIKQIAKELGSDEPTIRAWISKRKGK